MRSVLPPSDPRWKFLGRPARGSRHGRLRRAAGLLVFVVFLSGWAIDVGALHPCPHHAPPGATAAGEEAYEGEHRVAADHSHHADHATPDDHTPPAAPSPHPDHSGHEGPCTCRADCTGAAPIRAADPPAVERLPERIALRTVQGATILVPTRALLPHVLPWATAPPRF